MRISQMKVTEILVMDKADVTTRQDGSIIANPRVGRIGIQLYTGKELGRPDLEVVKVYRPESEVMDKVAMATVTHRPVTNDHPSEPVTADNWKKYAVGHTGDTVARDGDFIRVPMMLSDAKAIADFNSGKKELSLGYVSNLEWRAGQTPQGEAYDAVQTGIRVNHLAVVDAARGGPLLAIGDSVALCQASVDEAKRLIAERKVERKKTLDASSGNVLALAVRNGVHEYPFLRDGTVYRAALESIKVQAGTNQQPLVVAAADELVAMIDKQTEKKMSERPLVIQNIDGVPVEMSDIASSVVMRRIKGLETEASDLHSKLATAAAKAKKDEETAAEAAAKAKTQMESDAATITTLKKQLADAQVTPQTLDTMVAERADTVGRGRALLGDKLVTDGKTNIEMQRQVVETKIGDAAKAWSEDGIRASFATLTADIKPEQARSAAGDMARTFSGARTVNDAAGSDKIRNDYNKRTSDAWKGAAA